MGFTLQKREPSIVDLFRYANLPSADQALVYECVHALLLRDARKELVVLLCNTSDEHLGKKIWMELNGGLTFEQLCTIAPRANLREIRWLAANTLFTMKGVPVVQQRKSIRRMLTYIKVGESRALRQRAQEALVRLPDPVQEDLRYVSISASEEALAIEAVSKLIDLNCEVHNLHTVYLSSYYQAVRDLAGYALLKRNDFRESLKRKIRRAVLQTA